MPKMFTSLWLTLYHIFQLVSNPNVDQCVLIIMNEYYNKKKFSILPTDRLSNRYVFRVI